ncbi:MAG TPA: alpha/beta fold hydrolase [Anaeromyxobacter sp.]|nr:alpha/beta fold hydrolase [Anaeromyxobacter sp.]
MCAVLSGAAGGAWAPAGAWPWIALAVAVAAALAWLALRRRRFPSRRAHQRRATPRYPVVLAHGLLGFDEIRVGRARHDYFRGVSDRLERDGCVVHRCRVARTASIAARAAELAAFVRALPAPRVNLVAHSMGGLDARYALARLGLSRSVASLTTVGSPHRGTPLADLGSGLARSAAVGTALARIGMNVEALHDLTTDRMADFNSAVRDARGVMYASVVGAPRGRRTVTPILVPTWLWLGGEGLPNDGMVPAASQRWGDVVFEIEADHFAQIGWSRRFDAAEFYAELLRELKGRGM